MGSSSKTVIAPLAALALFALPVCGTALLTSAALSPSAAYAAGSGDNPSAGSTNVLPPFSDQSAWQVADYGGINIVAGQVRGGAPDVFSAVVRKTDGTDWHAAIQPVKPIHLVNGQAYTLTFTVRSDSPRNIRVFAQTVGGRNREVGLDETVGIGFPYQTFTRRFVAHGVRNQPVLLVFAIGQTSGRVWLRDVSLTGPSAGNNGQQNGDCPIP